MLSVASFLEHLDGLNTEGLLGVVIVFGFLTIVFVVGGAWERRNIRLLCRDIQWVLKNAHGTDRLKAIDDLTMKNLKEEK